MAGTLIGFAGQFDNPPSLPTATVKMYDGTVTRGYYVAADGSSVELGVHHRLVELNRDEVASISIASPKGSVRVPDSLAASAIRAIF